MIKTVQFFSDDYLENCKNLKPEQIVEFVENFRTLHTNADQARSKSRLISIKIPENLLAAFKLRAQLQGVPYQTQIKKLMKQWLGP